MIACVHKFKMELFRLLHAHGPLLYWVWAFLSDCIHNKCTRQTHHWILLLISPGHINCLIINIINEKQYYKSSKLTRMFWWKSWNANLRTSQRSNLQWSHLLPVLLRTDRAKIFGTLSYMYYNAGLQWNPAGFRNFKF